MNKFFFTLLFTYICSLYAPSFQTADASAFTSSACIDFIPSAISPNGDGINDEFTIRFSCNIGDYSLEIYDESQQLIHQSTDYQESWNGLFQGRPAPEGYYSWVIRYKSASDQEVERQEGELALVR